MALYNDATNLQGRGNFAPGVTYYAGIKAPTPAAPSLPKGEYNFNIDLAPIGNAFIRSQELEAHKIENEMERDLRIDIANMENDRAYDLADMQDRRERELESARLSQAWEIAKMNDATNRAKIAAQLQKNKNTTGERARMKDLALNDWFESPQYNNYLTNSKGINGNELALNLKEEMQTWMNSHPEYREFLSYSDIAKATQGTSGNYNKAATQLIVDQQNVNQKVGAALSPYATIEDQTRLGFEYNQRKDQIQLLNNLEASASADPDFPTEQLDSIKKMRTYLQMQTGDTEAVANVKTILTNMDLTDANIDEVKMETQKQLENYYKEINFTGDPTSVAAKKMDELGLNQMFEAYKTIKATSVSDTKNKRDMIKAGIEIAQYNDKVVGPFLSMSPEVQKLVLDRMDAQQKRSFADALESLFIPRVRLDGDKGATVYPAIFTSNPLLNMSKDQLDAVMSATGTNSYETAAMQLYWSVLNNDNADVNTKNAAASGMVGMASNGVSVENMSPEQIKNYSQNVSKLMSPMYKDAPVDEYIRMTGSNYYGRLLYATRKIASSVSASNSPISEPSYYASIKGARPEGLDDQTISAIFSGEQVSADKVLTLKSDKIFGYIGKDGNIMLDYDRKGILSGIGLPERNKALVNVMTVVTNNLDGDVKSQQVYYNNIFPNIEYLSGVNNGFFGRHRIKSATDLISYVWQNTSGQLMSWGGQMDNLVQDTVADVDKKVFGESNKTEQVGQESIPTAEEAFEMYMNRRSSEENKNEVKANAVNMLTKEAEHIRSVEGWEDKSVDGIEYKTYTEGGVLHILIGNDTFAFEFPLDKTEEELVADLRNNPKETVETLNGSWSRIK